MAWSFRQYSYDYDDCEVDAKKRRIGIWQVRQTQPPWQYRKDAWADALRTAPVGRPIKGNFRAKGGCIYHTPWSRSYRQLTNMKPPNRWFATEAEAIAAACRAARHSGPVIASRRTRTTDIPASGASRDGHVRGDVFYRTWPPRRQATVELILYIVFFYPAVLALIFAGWKFAYQSWGYKEVSVMSPANVPIFHFEMIIPAAGLLLAVQGVAQVCRCIICLRTGAWPERIADVEETETVLMHQAEDHAPIAGAQSRNDARPS